MKRETFEVRIDTVDTTLYIPPRTPPSCGDKCHYRSIGGKVYKNPRESHVFGETQSVLPVLNANSEYFRFIR